MTQYQIFMPQSKLVKIKRFCTAFEAARKFTITDLADKATYFSAISLDG